MLRVLRESSQRGRGCLSLATIAARARLSLSEVREALDELEARGIVLVSGDIACYTGFESQPEPLERGGLVEEILSRLRGFRRVVASVVRVSSIPHVDYIVARRDGIVFAIHIVRRGEAGERLEAIAAKLARQARRIAEGSYALELPVKLKVVVPVLAANHGAPRLVEGVVFRPAQKLEEHIIDPSPILSDPHARYYEARRDRRC